MKKIVIGLGALLIFLPVVTQAYSAYPYACFFYNRLPAVPLIGNEVDATVVYRDGVKHFSGKVFTSSFVSQVQYVLSNGNGGRCQFIGSGWTDVDLNEKCFCKMPDDPLAPNWSCQPFFYFDNGTFRDPETHDPSFTHEKPTPPCQDYALENYTLAKGCCCLTINKGQLNAERICKIVESKTPGTQPECDGKSTFNADIFAEVELSSLSPDGTCSNQEQVATGVIKPTGKTYDAAAELGSVAAKALNPMNFKTGTVGILDLIGRAIYYLTFIMGSLLLLFYVYAGVLWMTSGGNSERVGQAKKIVVWSTLGVVIMLASYALVSLVFKIVG